MQKANRIIKTVVAILLCLVLVTTCLLSGVFAKYVKNGTAEFEMLLKEWGVTVTMTNGTSFTNNVVSTTTSGSGTAAVTIKNFDIGPGDDFSDAVRFKITGTPEVPVKVTIGLDIQYTESNFKPLGASGATVIPFGVTFLGYNSSGTKLTTLGLTNDYLIAPCSSSFTSSTVATALANVINFSASGGQLSKDFLIASGNTTTSVLISKKGSTTISFNEFALGFKWPFTYSNSTYTAAKFDEINTFYGVRGTFPFQMKITVKVEQIKPASAS